MTPPPLFGSLPEELQPARRTLRVPELRSVTITSRVLAVIDHPAFQRLRAVRQLGPTHLVYPGAVHTRFEHSLGVYQTMNDFLLHLLRDERVRSSLSEHDLLCALAAALLHDIGHYPFAHSLEALHLKGDDTPRHEHVGALIVSGKIRALGADRQLSERLGAERPIAEILRRQWGVDPERVMALCTGELPEPSTQIDRLLRSLLSGAVDADKMDYLERDSHHMGVSYGRHYDRERLLQSLTLSRDEDALAISARGKVSAEMFVFARYTMFSEAYWHHTVRSASAMVESALAAFYSRTSLEPEELLPVLLARDDDAFLAWLREQSPPALGHDLPAQWHHRLAAATA